MSYAVSRFRRLDMGSARHTARARDSVGENIASHSRLGAITATAPSSSSHTARYVIEVTLAPAGPASIPPL